ncbi:MAG: hypothetical protein GY928_26000 [Colwellia sp.]|nr:hypothetical protein [Colwellia sp.]
MPSYSVAVPDIVAGGDPQTLVNIFSVAGVARGKINNIIVSSGATPDDQANNFEVMRTSAVGTEAGGVTPVALDPDTVASSFDAGQGHSVEPTETASSEMLAFSLNQRATFSWLANPGSELILPATTNNGINVVRRSGTAAYVIDCTVIFEE